MLSGLAKALEPTYGFVVEGTIEADGRPCFDGRFVCVCVDASAQGKDNLRSIPLHPKLRAAAEADLRRA